MSMDFYRFDDPIFVERLRLIVVVIIVFFVGSGPVSCIIVGASISVAARKRVAVVGLSEEVVAILGHLHQVL